MIERYSDHAANERTFLAWVRTSIAIMAFGFLVRPEAQKKRNDPRFPNWRNVVGCCRHSRFHRPAEQERGKPGLSAV